MPAPQPVVTGPPTDDMPAGPLYLHAGGKTFAGLLELLLSIDHRLANLEAKLAEYEPLAQLARDRAERGSRWSRFGQGGNPNGG